MGASNYTTVQVEEIEQETDKAFLMRVDGTAVWVPFSQMADPDDYRKGDRDVEVSVTEWMAKLLGLDVEG